MEVKIVYDEQDYNSGVVYVGAGIFKYNYDTDIKEFLITVLDELDIEYEVKAFNFEEEE